MIPIIIVLGRFRFHDLIRSAEDMRQIMVTILLLFIIAITNVIFMLSNDNLLLLLLRIALQSAIVKVIIAFADPIAIARIGRSSRR